MADLSDPVVRAAMKALTETGHYREEPDSFEWLTREAADCAEVLRNYDRHEIRRWAVYDLLGVNGSCLHDTTDEEQAWCLALDAEAVVTAMEAV